MTQAEAETSDSFNPLRIVVAVLLLLLAVAFAARWYGEQVGVPRYCDDPGQALAQLEQILTEALPAGDGPRLPYIVAAKLLFLIPQTAGEPLADYLDRVRAQLQRECR